MSTVCPSVATVEESLTFAHAGLASFEENTALLAAVRWRRGETACHGRKTPLLDIRFDKDEAHLAKVDLYVAGAVGADCREEVLRLEPVSNIVELLAVAGEEDSTASWPIAYSDYITSNVRRSIGRCRIERLVESAYARREVGY